jgi:phage shock protein E
VIEKSRALVLATSILLCGCGSSIENSIGEPIAASELSDRIESGLAPVVLDVRSREEYSKGHIQGAINIPHDELADRLGELRVSKSEEIVVHCQSGRRAQMAEQTLLKSGYSNVRDLAGHWQTWSREPQSP